MVRTAGIEQILNRLGALSDYGFPDHTTSRVAAVHYKSHAERDSGPAYAKSSADF